jgi:hypothetical protein
MNKVKIEVTENGWIITVKLNSKTFVEKHEATPTGAICTEGNFDNVDMDDNLRDSLQGTENYDIMQALKMYCDEK